MHTHTEDSHKCSLSTLNCRTSSEKKSKMYVVLPGLQDSCKQKKEAKAYKISAIKCPQLKHFLLVYD